MLSSSKTLIIDYYQSSYGPSIMIKTNSIDHLIELKEIMSKLKHKIIPEYCLSNMANAHIMGMKDLIMKIKTKVQPNKKITEFKDGNQILQWLININDLEYYEGLIDGLIESNKPGHQYLTNEGDNVLIELSYME
ncbi:MAG: hypothetical protein HPY90_15065 [Syntrophothermus sp.]|uniref:hypothetical protein n=1 Tax=Syntrophothermus sp. TaxID=2736299 RepID=UPI00257C575F|nr:hypothetical protein [Syntrophothermus sp.]NSW84525.1 hypothetical protein [Syntrophothermus sp.]